MGRLAEKGREMGGKSDEGRGGELRRRRAAPPREIRADVCISSKGMMGASALTHTLSLSS